MTRLLVPMTVEALLVGQPDVVTAINPRFFVMGDPYYLTLGTDIEPQPFETSTNMPPGIHVRWTLPDTLAHGVQGQAVGTAVLTGGAVTSVTLLNGGFGYDPAVPPLVMFSGGGGAGASARAIVGSDGIMTSIEVLTGGMGYEAAPTVEIGSSDEIRYPEIPNRWFVLRSHADNSTRKVTMKSWVVVSDTLSGNMIGRIVEGTLPLSLQSQLKSGTITPALRDAMNTLGLSVSASATLDQPYGVSNLWYIFDQPVSYSIEVRTNDLLVLGTETVSWPRIPEPDPYKADRLYAYLGRTWPYSMWDGGSPPQAENRLTAIGPGDPTFAAAYPNSRSVLGFFDNMSDLPSGRVTYMVAGWYSKPAGNPLWGADTAEKWAARMTELRWCMKQDPGGYPPASICGVTEEETTGAAAELPQDVLLQGMVYDVGWTGPATKYPSGVPAGKPDIAVGNTAAEALSALVASKIPEDPAIEELLEAFMYDALDLLQQPDGMILLEQAFHAKMFGNRPSETIWGLMEKQTESAEVRHDKSLGAPFPPDVSAALTRTNEVQAAFDRKEAELRSLQWETYSAWFRYVLAGRDPTVVATLHQDLFTHFEAPRPQPAEARRLRDADSAAAGIPITPAQAKVVVDRLIVLVNAAKTQRNTLAADLQTSIANLIALVAEKMSGYEVTRSAGRSFWQANDPVVLFAGDGVERTFAFGEDAALADGESLPCRATGQTITALTTPVPGYADQTITQTQLQQWYGSFPSGAPIPAEIQPLFIETLLLDTTMDVLMSISAWSLAGVNNPTQPQIDEVAASIHAIQTAPLNAYLHFARRRELRVSAQALAEAAGFTGVYPYKIAVDPWSQPWAPIYLEWDVLWSPSDVPPGKMEICDTSLSCTKKWMFGEWDFAWNTQFPPDTAPRYGYSGRTVITPQAPDQLARKLEKYLQTHPDSPYYKQLEKAYEAVRNLQVLSQNMSGFTYSLTQRRETLQMPVIDYFDQALSKRVAAAIGTQNQFSPLPANGYSPLRGGHARIVRLWVVDSFGQAQRIIDAGQTYNPILSKPLITAGNPALIQLVPRIVQPDRLDMDWIKATNDAQFSTSDPATSPICGWIVQNYFDNSIMVYDSFGGPVGALQLLQGAFGTNESGVRWLETPGTDSAVGAQPALDNPDLNAHLKGFLQGILRYGAEGHQALADLIVTLHKTLSTIVIAGSAANYGNLPVLVGRPMALVRAAFRIDLD